MTIEFNLNGKNINANPNHTILDIAQQQGITIPHLCYSKREGIAGNCRTCMVEIDGERVLAASCCRQPTAGMTVNTASTRAVKAQTMVLELLQSDMPEQTSDNSELNIWANKLFVSNPRFGARIQPKEDLSHPAISVNMDSCIQCTRCLRACRELQNNDVIGLAGRGDAAKIVFDFDAVMGNSTCVACGECVAACPTDALVSRNNKAYDKIVDSICPYCGVGCQLTYQVKDSQIVAVQGRNGPANDGRLCVKGRYGFDYIHHQQRLTKPLIRRANVPKNLAVNPDNYSEVFREASWNEALDLVAAGFKKILKNQGGNALAGFGCAKGSNEEAYLFQKLIRTGFKTNNVDHCTRLCHASSVTALLECLGSGSVSNPIRDVENSEVILIIGANPTVNHPVGATWIKNAVKKGAKLILMDPRRTELSRLATFSLQFKPGTDVPMLNAIMHTIIKENLINQDFIDNRTEGFAELSQHLKNYSPELMAEVCGVPADILIKVARLYAQAKSAMILWGMGVSQHIHGTNNARCLISLALMTGQIGRPGTGLHPLRGQNNVQGASDMGLIPMVFPDYQRVDDSQALAKFEKLWQTKLDNKPGLTVVEITEQMYDQHIIGLYIMGENPAMSDPDANHAQAALAKLELLVVQDIFLTETAYFADVVLPASAFAEKTGTFTNSDRLVQLGTQVISPPGEAKQDLWIIQQIAQRLGLDWDYPNPAAVFAEIRQAVPTMAGITWQRLELTRAVVYPCVKENDTGQSIIFTETFPTNNSLGKFVTADIIAPEERPDAEYPFVLITGRILEHWHTGSMTRRAKILDALQPIAEASLHPDDLTALQVTAGDTIILSTRRGQISITAVADDAVPSGAVFMPFCYYEAAANELSIAAIDPVAKIPEFKYCALKITASDSVITQVSGYNTNAI